MDRDPDTRRRRWPLNSSPSLRDSHPQKTGCVGSGGSLLESSTSVTVMLPAQEPSIVCTARMSRIMKRPVGGPSGPLVAGRIGTPFLASDADSCRLTFPACSGWLYLSRTSFFNPTGHSSNPAGTGPACKSKTQCPEAAPQRGQDSLSAARESAAGHHWIGIVPDSNPQANANDPATYSRQCKCIIAIEYPGADTSQDRRRA